MLGIVSRLFLVFAVLLAPNIQPARANEKDSPPSSRRTDGLEQTASGSPFPGIRQAASYRKLVSQQEGLPFVQGYSSSDSVVGMSYSANNQSNAQHLCGTCGGRARNHDCPYDYCERPFGSFVRTQFNTQIANGLASQMVLYRYDFHSDKGDRNFMLTPRGLSQLEKIGAIGNLLPFEENQITIEATRDAQLNDARRIHVVEELTARAIPIAEERVVFGTPIPVGMSGAEAFDVYQNLRNQTRGRGGSLRPIGAARSGYGTAEVLGRQRSR